MPRISTFVFFDIETTGLPHLENNETKITECSFIAVRREDFDITSYGNIPPVSKLTFVLNPQRRIDPAVTQLTGLSNELLRNAPLFHQKIPSVITFLKDLQSPVCLVAHNGNSFDYKILLAECNDASAYLPSDLLCVDSLVGIRKILNGSSLDYTDFEKQVPTSTVEDLLTDDEDDWPDLSISCKEWDEIDDLSLSLSDMSCEDVEIAAKEEVAKVKQSRSRAIRKMFDKNTNNVKQNSNKLRPDAKSGNNKVPNSRIQNTDFKLTTIYKRLLNREVTNAHRAEEDCLMLIKCVVALKHEFLPWADTHCKLLTEVKPLHRYWRKK